MTGRWPYEQGLIANHMRLGRVASTCRPGKGTRGTLAWAFKDAGYETGLLRQVAPGRRPLRTPDAPPDGRPFGFDRTSPLDRHEQPSQRRASARTARRGRALGRASRMPRRPSTRRWPGSPSQPAAARTVLRRSSRSIRRTGRSTTRSDAKKVALYPDVEALPFHPLDVRLRLGVNIATTTRSSAASTTRSDASTGCSRLESLGVGRRRRS